MRIAAVVLASVLLALAGLPGAAAAPGRESGPGRYDHYVALGDSYAAGPGIPVQDEQLAGCARSDHNYASRLAGWLRPAEFTDVTCSGATTVHLTGPQQVAGGVNPPQLDALADDTDLVTLTIGGNDIGFGEIVATCAQLGAGDPQGDPCRRHYGAKGTDELAARVRALAPRIDRVLATVRDRSPDATVLLVGYLRILPAGTGCWPQMPFAAGDTAYFDGVEQLLNRTLAERARAGGARFVDPYLFSGGHDACRPPEQRWVEPLRPASPSAPVHPNAAGMTVVAGLAWLTAKFGR